jgi:hypothetical protein
VDRSGAQAGVLRDLLKQLLDTAKLHGETETWWREAFVDDQLLPYSGTFVLDSAGKDWDELLYRLRNTFPGARTIAPGEAGCACPNQTCFHTRSARLLSLRCMLSVSQPWTLQTRFSSGRLCRRICVKSTFLWF